VFIWIAAGQDQLPNYLLPVWNTLISAGMIVILIGLLGRNEWARQWAIGTSVLSVVGEGLRVAQGSTLIPLVGVAAGVVTAGCLTAAKREFVVDSVNPMKLKSVSNRQVLLTLGLVLGAIVVSSMGSGGMSVGGERAREAFAAELQGNYAAAGITSVTVKASGTNMTIASPTESDERIETAAEEVRQQLRASGSNAKAWIVGFKQIIVTNGQRTVRLTP